MIPLDVFLGALLVEGVLFAIPLAALAVVHSRERRDLYSRIMARDLGEFVRSQAGTPPKGRNLVKEAIDRAVDVTDA